MQENNSDFINYPLLIEKVKRSFLRKKINVNHFNYLDKRTVRSALFDYFLKYHSLDIYVNKVNTNDPFCINNLHKSNKYAVLWYFAHYSFSDIYPETIDVNSGEEKDELHYYLDNVSDFNGFLDSHESLLDMKKIKDHCFANGFKNLIEQHSEIQRDMNEEFKEYYYWFFICFSKTIASKVPKQIKKEASEMVFLLSKS
jgi:hypothetical protein